MYQSKLNNFNLRSALLLGAASAAVLSFITPVLADEAVETVVVTGSRIPQQGLYSSSPVTAVGQQEIQFEGTTNVENLINNLPSAVADFTETASNGATGTATVDLRGLGPVRTLVLVDGKRLMPGDPNNTGSGENGASDLNNIPAALVDHVEVLTGGASAVYGSDAEAGVVNFIMRKDFEGIELDGQYSVDNAANNDSASHARIAPFVSTPGFDFAKKDWWGGATDDATLLIGANTDNGKGNITAYLSYRNIQPILQSSRDFSSCSVAVSRSDHLGCFGSANKNAWLSIDDYEAYLGDSSIPYFFYQEGTGHPGSGTFTQFTGSHDQRYNFGAQNYLQRPDTRYTGGYFGHYEVNKQLDVYSSFMFADDHTLAQIAPSGLFIGTGLHSGYVEVNCSNPLMTPTENQALCGETPGSTQVGGVWNGNGNLTAGQALIGIGRRDLEGGDRIDDLRHTSYRMVVGAKGDLGEGWAYDVYGQYGTTVYQENYRNEFSVSRVQNALQVNPGTGNCVAADSGVDLACVPLDIFNGFGSISPSMLNYVSAQGFKTGSTEEQVLSGSLTGDLGEWGLQSPAAKSPVSLALGAEYRAEYLELQTSRDFQLNDLYGQGSATLPVPKSGFNVVEGFGEVRVPIVQDHPFFEDLTVNAGYRYSSYSTAGAVSSYKYGAEWQPIDDFRLRGSFQRAVRAPNVLELFAPANVILFGGTDPCAGHPTGVVATNCNNFGAPTSIPCPAAQCKEQVEGNINLKPEQSDTKSFGIVLTPTFVTGLTATIDYFDIKVNDYIDSVDANTTLAACYGAAATAASQALACPLVEPFRNPITHSIAGTGYVSAQTVNATSLATRGWDFEANYQSDLSDWGMGDNGALAVNFIGTITEHLTTQPYAGFFSYDCAGLFGQVCGTPTPKWRHKLRVTWSSPWDFDFSVAWRHLSGVSLDMNTDNPLLNGGIGASGYPNPDLSDAHISAFNYFDLAANWTLRQGVELRAGVNNVFDKTPPVVDSTNYGVSSPPFGNGNTYPGVYDSLGRNIFVGATIKY